ncbi:MAG: putative quinol monooxygenase [Acidimicrobiales bacterium]
MLIIAGTFTFDPDNTEAVRQASTNVMSATRQEEGCYEYTFSIDLADSASLCVFEVWESEDHLKEHFKTSHVAEFSAAMKDFGISDRSLHKYQISSSDSM